MGSSAARLSVTIGSLRATAIVEWHRSPLLSATNELARIVTEGLILTCFSRAEAEERNRGGPILDVVSARREDAKRHVSERDQNPEGLQWRMRDRRFA